MSENVEQESEATDQADYEEIVVEVPVVDTGCYLYVCAACGADLTEIPYYNRFYCENCGLHY